MKRKLTPMDRHFIRWYENHKDSFRDKVHRWLNPNCKHCKSSDIAYKELNDTIQELGE